MATKKHVLSPEKQARLEQFNALLVKHGFRPVAGASSGKLGLGRTSREALAKTEGILVEWEGQEYRLRQLTGGEEGEVSRAVILEWSDNEDGYILRDPLPGERRAFTPKNLIFLEFARRKFAQLGFEWSIGVGGNGSAYVGHVNFPRVAGRSLTLFELIQTPIELVDGWQERQVRVTLSGRVEEFVARRRTMDATGIGYKGTAGVSWLPSAEPFVLSRSFEAMLNALAAAVFLFMDVVAELLPEDIALQELLGHKRPDRIPDMNGPGRTSIIRPDIVVVKDEHGLRPVVTELESCPAGQGMTHAVQVGYGLRTDMVDKFIRFLNGRPFLVLATNEWSEYVWEQAAFCKALTERGVQAHLLFDRPLDEVHRLAQSWACPKSAPDWMARHWDRNFLGRLAAGGLREYVGGTANLPATVGDAVVFRFGYFDNFEPKTIAALQAWQEAGATISNPLQSHLENKVMMVAFDLPSVQAELRRRDPAAVDILKRSLATTWVLDPKYVDVDDVIAQQRLRVAKFAAWDGGQGSWGAHSVKIGADETGAEWERIIRQYVQLPHPVVVQHVIASSRWTVPYVEAAGLGEIATKGDLRTRLTPFFLRGDDGLVAHAGSMITLRQNDRVHGASDAIEGPVVFRDEEVQR